MMMHEQAMIDTVAASISEVRKNIEHEIQAKSIYWHPDATTAIEAVVNRISHELRDCVEDFNPERFNLIAFSDDWERYV